MPHQSNELLRKALHVGFGLLAFSLKWLPWTVAAGVAAAAVIGNWLVLHRVVGKRVARHERGFDAGILLYPLMVLLLIVVFRDRLEIAAVGWAILAFGDGLATIAGRMMRIAPLPWNPDKSWGGFLGFLIPGAAAAYGVAMFFGSSTTAALIAVVVAAFVESIDTGVDDNVTVPVAAALVLWLLATPDWPPLPVPDWPWLAVNAVLAIIGYAAKSVDVSGAVGGFLLGSILILFGGWPLYASLLGFFIVGTACTKLGYQRKARMGLAQEQGGRRGFRHAFSNVGVAAIYAVAAWRLGGNVAMLIAGVASLATAAADTTASELGQLFGKRPFLPLTLRRVPVGTEGAVSIEGTLFGIGGGFVVAAIGAWAYGRLDAIPLLTLAAFAGSYVESIVGSWNRKQAKPVSNGALNFFNTAVGAAVYLMLAL